MPFNISPAHLALTGRILFLVTRPELMAAQLAGADLTLAEAGTLQGDVSTDEITPAVSAIRHRPRARLLRLRARSGWQVRRP